MTLHDTAPSKTAAPGNKRKTRAFTAFKAVTFGISLIVLPAGAHAQDVFTGMVIADNQELVLERCHVGKTRYRLIAAPDSGDPLAQLRGKDGLVQADIFAHYRADGDGHVLEVMAVENIEQGKTCHLVDAIEAHLSSSALTPDHDADKEQWMSLALGNAAPPEVEVIGSGEYAYRFVLLQPRTGKPAADTDYALSASRATDYELPFVKDEKKVFQGRTDEQGRTPVFRLPVRLPDAAFDLRERFGSGPYGETFHLTDHHDNDLFNMPYLLITCTTPPRFFRGYTYPNGDTVYTASDGPINIQLRTLDGIEGPLPSNCDDGRSKDGDDAVLPTEDGAANSTGNSGR